MSDLKSAWELSLEKSDKMDPGIKKKKKTDPEAKRTDQRNPKRLSGENCR